MKKICNGSMTVFLSLLMFLFLTFCLVLLEGVRMYYFRSVAEQAAEIAGFSVLSEFRPELLENYGLFFLDLDYGQPKEQTSVLHARASQYLTENAQEIRTQNLNIRSFVRATDGGGSAFFEQAVSGIKSNPWFELFGKAVGEIAFEDVEHTLKERIASETAAAREILSGLKDEEGVPLFEISIPEISFPGIGMIAGAVLGEEAAISEKSFSEAERIGKRRLQKGVGEETRKNFQKMQLFHQYVLQRCSSYGNDREEIPAEALEYQVEYIIAGNDNDRDNLEEIVWKIFLVRCGGNYVFYHQDQERLASAEAKAILTAGITGNEALIQIVKELFLLAEAVGEGIRETGEIFRGEKLPFIQNGVLSEWKAGYREYLLLFLQMTGAEEKVFRCMDVLEMEMRKIPGCENFRFDHCTDCFEMQWTYRFDSLFLQIPLMEGTVYQNRITRKIYYNK